MRLESTPHPWDTHYQFSIKNLLPKEPTRATPAPLGYPLSVSCDNSTLKKVVRHPKIIPKLDHRHEHRPRLGTPRNYVLENGHGGLGLVFVQTASCAGLDCTLNPSDDVSGASWARILR